MGARTRSQWIAVAAVALLLACAPAGCSGLDPQEQGGGAGQNAPDQYPLNATALDDLPVYPKSPPVGHLRVIDLAGQHETVKLLVASLQGIVNRTEPRIFTLHIEDGGPYHEDFWLQELVDHFNVTYETVPSVDALLDEFESEIEGAVVPDPALKHTNNVAVMLAATQNLIIVDPTLLDWITGRGIGVVEDLRGRFSSTPEMYQWAFEELWPLCNQGVLNYHRPDLAMSKDYAVAHKIFTVAPDIHRPEERAVWEQILDETPCNIPVLGWVLDELLGVAILSQYGKFLTASEGSPNLSVYSGLTLDAPEPVTLPELPELENTIYVAFAYTDADNETYVQRSMLDPWWDAARGSVPIGWLFNAAIRDMAPQMVRYYHETLTDQDCFIGPVSGLGYMYPRLYPDLDRFLELSAEYWEWSGFPNVWVINDDLTLSDELVAAYADALPINEQGMFVDYWPNADRGWHWAADGTPVVRSQYVYLVGPEQMDAIFENAAVAKQYLYPDEPYYLFIGVNGWVVTPAMIAELAQGLDERFTLVRPDVMLALLRRAAP